MSNVLIVLVKSPMKRHITSGALAIIAASTLLVSFFALPVFGGEAPKWSYQTVATGGSFGTICMVLDSHDNPNIVYNGVNGIMFYAKWEDSNWKIQDIIQGGDPISLVLDSKDIPHILFKGANGVIYYASLKGGSWSYQAVPAGNRYSLALDKQDNPHIAYGTQLLIRDYPPGITDNFYALNYASWNGTNWNSQVVQQQISSQDTISLALDSNDNPIIMYGSDTYYPPSGGYTLTVKIATWTGSNWSIQTGPSDLDSIGSMVLDSQDNPRFAYGRKYPHESIGNVSLGYASWNGATWSTQTVASHLYLPGIILQSNLVLDSHDNPHIEFFNGSLIYASSTDSNWSLETVAPDQFAYGEGPLALDSHDKPSICYWVDDIHNSTAFVSQLLYTTPTPVLVPSPTPSPTPLATPNPLASVSQLWVFKPAYSIISSTVLSNGLLYLTSGDSGTGTLALYCINPSTGAQVWNCTSFFANFTVSGGYIFLGGAAYSASYSLQGVVSCLNATTGTQVWNFSGGTSFSSPLLSDGVVYVGGYQYNLSSGVSVGSILAFNTSTGDKLWTFQGQQNTRFGSQPLVLQDTTLYALSAAYDSADASYHSAIYAFNASDGKHVWNYTAPGSFGSFVAAGQNLIITSSYVDTQNNIDAETSGGYVYQGGVFALDAQDGTPLWNYPIDSSVGTPIAVGNTVYVTTGEGTIYAFNSVDGSIVWKYTAGMGLDTILSVDGYLYVGSSFGVHCFNAANGAIIWKFATSDFSSSSPTSPTYADGVIYVGWNGPTSFAPATTHNFYGLRASSGQTLWNFSLPYSVSSTPMVENGIVLIGGNFVTARSPDFESPGAVVGLKSSITSLPMGSPPTSTLPSETSQPTSSLSVPEFPTWIIIPSLMVVAASAAVLVRNKRQSQSTDLTFEGLEETEFLF
jgi:outer membrane protein assembly factor BamB